MLIERHRVDWMYAVPTMMHRIWRLPEAERTRFDLSSLRVVFHMAAPCPPWLKEAWIGWLGGERILELYGGTEAQAITFITGDEWLAHRGSVGRVLLGEMRVLDPDGEELPAGQVGEIWMRRGAGRAADLPLRRGQCQVTAGQLGVARRHGLDGRGGLPLPERPRDRHDPGRRQQRVSRRGGGRARRASGAWRRRA